MFDFFATPWTITHQAPPPMGFPRQKYWSGCCFINQIFLTQGSNPHAWQVGSLPLSHSKCCNPSKTQIWLLATQNAILERQMLVEQEGSFIQEAGI